CSESRALTEASVLTTARCVELPERLCPTGLRSRRHLTIHPPGSVYLFSRAASGPKSRGVSSDRALELDVTQQSSHQRLGVSDDCEPPPPPGHLYDACAPLGGNSLAHMQPAFEFTQELIDATGQRHQLFVVGRFVARLHSEVITHGARGRMS